MDLASASPKDKLAVATLVIPQGAAFADGAIEGSTLEHGHAVPMIVSGPGAATFAELMTPWGMRIAVVSPETGKASAIKTLRHVVQKGIMALLIECTVAARKYGLTDEVLASIAEWYDALPFMLLPLYVALQRIDPAHVEAAADLYASGAERFRTVILPLSAPGIYSGIVLVAITNVGDYVSAAILGGPSTTMIGNIIQTQYVNDANYPVASALALILMAVLMVAMGIYARIFGTRTLQEHGT